MNVDHEINDILIIFNFKQNVIMEKTIISTSTILMGGAYFEK